MDDLLFSENKLRNDERRKQELDDLSAVMRTPAGFRVLTRILRGLGYGSYIGSDAGAVALHNQANSIMADMTQADAGGALQVIAAIYRIEI